MAMVRKPDSDSQTNIHDLDKKYRRRAKVAAWVSSLGGFGLAGGLAEAALAEPAVAATPDAYEVAGNYNPVEYYNQMVGQITKLGNTLAHEPGVQILTGNQIPVAVPGSHPTGVTEYLWRTNGSRPGRYNWVTMLTKKGINTPLLFNTVLNADSKSYFKIKNADRTYSFWLFGINYANNQVEVDYKIQLSTNTGNLLGSNPDRYEISRVQTSMFPGFGAGGSTSYNPANPKMVISQFNTALTATANTLTGKH